MRKYRSRSALRATLLYGIFAGAWILLSDRLLSALISDSEVVLRLQTFKGWAFVGVTAVMLYAIVRDLTHRWEREVSDREQAEEELRQKTTHLQNALGMAGMDVWRRNLQTDELLTVEGHGLISGLPDDLYPKTGRAFFELVHPEDRATVGQSIERAKEEDDYKVEFRIVLPSGEIRWVAARGRCLHDAEGKPTVLTGVDLDITERKQAEIRLRHLNRVYAVLSDINQTIVRVHEPEALLAEACRIAVEKGGFRMAWAGRLNSKTNRVEPVAHAGFSDGYVENLNILIGEDPDTEGPTAAALRHGQHFVCNDIEHDPRMSPWREAALQRGYRAISVFPLKIGGKTVGVFDLYAIEPGFFNDQETQLLNELAEDISFALEVHELELERKSATGAVRKLSHAVEQSPVSVIITDTAGTIQYVNRKFTELTGYTAEEAVGQNPRILKSGKHPMELYERLWQTITSGRTWTGELQNRRKDGELYWEWATISSLRDDTGKITHFVAFKEDITERKRTEAALGESEEKFRQLAENINEVFWITDPARTRMLYVSPAYEKMWGRTTESLYASPRTWGDAIHPEDRERILDVAATKQVRGEYDEIYRITRPDGSLRWIHDRAFPLSNTAGEVYRIVGTAADITEQRNLEQQFRQAQKMEAIGQLAGGVAHDFNNVLAVIQMQAGLLEGEKGITAAQLETVREIGNAAQRAANLTRQLLMFSRRQTMQPRELDLNDLVANVTKMLQRILGEDIRMQFSYSPQPLILNADAGMLDQILLNLAVNSRDAMPRGGRLIIETSAVEVDDLTAVQYPQARPGSFACLSVSDTGCGIPPEILPRIFEPFFTTKDVGKGTGLGLATVYGIVQQHQGWIYVYSAMGRGSTFRVFLPRLPRTGDEATVTPRLKTLPGGDETLLVVEDDPTLRTVVGKILARLGYRVFEAPSGISALELWKEKRKEIRLLLTDMIMPDGMNGKELAEQLLRENPKLKVIYTSGYSADIAGKDFPLEEGVNFLAKPFEAHRLAQTVRARLDG